MIETPKSTQEKEPTTSRLGSTNKEKLDSSWGYSTDDGDWVDFRDLLSPYREFATELRTKETPHFKEVGDGLSIEYETQGNTVRIIVTIGSYNLISTV